MEKFFNTAGPCLPERHYMIPPERRLGQVRELIDKAAFFVIHAPRQTGKTTLIRTLSRKLTAEGNYGALTVSLESLTRRNVKFGLAEKLWRKASLWLGSDILVLSPLFPVLHPLKDLGRHAVLSLKTSWRRTRLGSGRVPDVGFSQILICRLGRRNRRGEGRLFWALQIRVDLKSESFPLRR
jgi:hypothetical protein